MAPCVGEAVIGGRQVGVVSGAQHLVFLEFTMRCRIVANVPLLQLRRLAGRG